jgi:hypothetical protein
MVGYVFEETTLDAITFDLTSYRPIVIGDNGYPVFAEGPAFTDRLPKENDVIIYTKLTRSGRTRIGSWAFLEEYDQKVTDMRLATGDDETYRIQAKYDFELEPTTVFLGDLGDMMRKFPKPIETDRADQMQTEECDTFSVSRWFERLQDDGWVQCADPRPAVDAMTVRRLALAKTSS